jgi:hypothetical protein
MAKQGGLLGHVTVPRTYKEPGSHKVELAYITKKEANKLKELDLHNSGIGKEMHYGPEGIPNYNGGGGGRSGGGGGGNGARDDIREAARTVSAIASARAAPRGALERLGAQRASAAQSGPRGALERVAAKRAAAERAPVSRPAPVTESRYTPTNQPTTNMNIIERILSPKFNKSAHKTQSQIYENLANQGSITGSTADKLKGWDLVKQGFNPMFGLVGSVPYQVLTNTYDQYDPNNPWSSAWGGVTSGLGQGWSNMQGIVGGLLGHRPGPDI